MNKLKLTKEYQRYHEYKDSGLEWIGEIPKEWSVDKLRHIHIKNDGGVWGDEDPRERGVFVLRSTEVTQEGKWDLTNPVSRLLSESEKKSSILLEGDLLITKSSGSRAHLGKTAIVDKQMSGIYVFSNFMQRLRLRSQEMPRFYFYLLNNTVVRDQINYWGTTTSGLVNLNAKLINSFVVPIPPKEEQKRIADFLDEKTELIDQIIARKKRLIELLKEKRTAVINQKTDVAEGEPINIKNCAYFNPSKSEIGRCAASDVVSFVPMEALSETGKLTLQQRPYEQVKNGFTYFANDDVVLAKITPCYENGKSGVIEDLLNGFGFGTTEFIVLRPQKEILSQFLYYLVYSDKFRKKGEIEMRGTAGQKRVTNQYVQNYEFMLPSIEQQKNIVEYLQEYTKLADRTIEVIQRSIKQIQEFKRELISNAVTGKIKVGYENY